MIDGYRTELDAPVLSLARGSRGPGVLRVQEWLGLHGLGVVIDGEFGPATEAALARFQAAAGLPDRLQGSVDHATWAALTAPLVRATLKPSADDPGLFGPLAVALASRYLQERAREIGGDNCGPWVRHFCRGYAVPWCQGFASTVWADAARALGLAVPPLALVLDGIWCLYVPRMAAEARARGRFLDGRTIEVGRIVPAGSQFFLRGGPGGYLHVGLVTAHRGDLIETIEGNTNEDGSANGYEVARRIRRTITCDYGLVD